jgi:hypothetical protein
LDNLAILHDRDAVGQPDRLVKVMGDEHDCFLQHRLQANEFILHFAPDQRVEGGKRLVEEPKLGFHGQRPGDADALLLTTRKLAGIGRFAAPQTDPFDHFHRPLSADVGFTSRTAPIRPAASTAAGDGSDIAANFCVARLPNSFQTLRQISLDWVMRNL